MNIFNGRAMSEKFRNKYRIPSARRPNWDYAWSANYFITICTHHRQAFFGDIVNGRMELSEIGRIVELEWLKTPDVRPDMNLHLGVFVVMPNHFHAIITIGENQFIKDRDAMHDKDATHDRDAKHCVSTDYKNAFVPQSKNKSSIVRGFKSAVTVQAHVIHTDFAWQTRFHDHIIRNSVSHDTIERYIFNNPINWLEDKFYTAL
jgi:putative transposase